MENPEEILHSLEEFSKLKPKDIPRELEEYLCFVAKTGNPVYQWPIVKSLFREKLLSVITEFYESCPTVDIPPCPNVEMFNYDLMKNFILEKLDTFAAAPFTVQRICELLTTPRKEYNRIDKYMRALEKNILVVSTTEPGRRSTENGEGIMNGIESEHLPESSNSSHDINVEEMDETPSWPKVAQVAPVLFENTESENQINTEIQPIPVQETFDNSEETKLEVPSSSTANLTQPLPDQQETVITCRTIEEAPYVSIEPIPLNTCVTSHQDVVEENQADSSVTITAVPAGLQQRRSSMERVESSESTPTESEEVKVEAVEEKLSEKKEEVDELKEEITSTVICPEPVAEVVPETKIVIHSEEPSLVGQEELGIENISPENSSSSPETLQIDVSSDQERNEPEKLEKVEICLENQETEEEKKSEDSKWTEEEKDPLLLEENVEDTEDLDGIPLVEDGENEDLPEDKIVDEPTSLNKLIEESVDKAAVPEEESVEDKPVVEEIKNELKEKKLTEEIPMEVDIINEPDLKKPEESTADEPSSTSDTAL